MKKSDINALLKDDFGLANIKMKKDYSGIDTVTVKEGGKMVKGMPLGSHSPMDSTCIPLERVSTNLQKIHHTLAGKLRKDGERYIVSETSRSITYLSIHSERYPTYTRSMGLDSGYQTSYAIPTYITEKK